MGQIICITNLKGGSGKTTTAINLSASLAVAEKKTLLIDCDPQGNATIGLGFNKKTIINSIYHSIVNNNINKELILKTELEYLQIIPSKIELLRAEVRNSSKKIKEDCIRNLLKAIKKDFDYIIIDTSPSMGILTINSLVAADSFLVPLPCEFYALEGFGQILKIIKLIKKNFNSDLTMNGTLLTMYNDSEEISKKIAHEVQRRLKHKVYKTIIPYDRNIKESPCYGKSLLSINANTNEANHYFSLANEIISQK